MAKILEDIICSKCEKSFKTEYLIPQNISKPLYDFDTVGEGITARRKNGIHENEFILEVNCPECGQANIFTKSK